MLGALAAVGFWSLSTIVSARASHHLGGISANLVRLAMAFPLLLATSLSLGCSPAATLSGPAMPWLVLSGICGMCACDILTMMAYGRLGPRIPTLIIDCGSVPVAVLIGWICLDEIPSASQLGCMALIVVGLMAVLRPRSGDRNDMAGIISACGAGVFFAIATGCLRMAFQHTPGTAPLHWLDAAVVRSGAGLLATAMAFFAVGTIARPWRDGPGRWRAALPWLALNALLGPGLGLACFQSALAANQASVVHAIVAFVPLVILAVGWLTRADEPDAVSVYGSIASVLGVILLLCTSIPVE